MLENPIKWKLKENRAVFGTGLTGPVELPVLRTLAGCGVEWLFVDLEHGSIGMSNLLDTVQVADLLGMCAVPRIPVLEYSWISRSLDTGALSVMVPRVESVEQAELAVQSCKFPPRGIRGIGSPSYLGYAPLSMAEGVTLSNAETMVVLQIETLRGVEEVEAIAAVPGVDALFIGPADMSVALGRPGDVASDESHALFQRICGAARDNGLAVGIVCQPSLVSLYYEMGVRMFSIGSALGHMRAGVMAAASAFREQVGEG